MKKFLEKYFNNENIGLVHWFILIEVIFGVLLALTQTDLNNIPMDFMLIISLLILISTALNASKNNIALKWIAVGLGYCEFFLFLNDFFSNMMSDTVNIIFITPAILFGLWLFIQVVKKYFIKK